LCGGLLLPRSLKRYRERFSISLLTASGSLANCFRSRAALFFGIVSQRAAIEDLFIAGCCRPSMLGLSPPWRAQGLGRKPTGAVPVERGRAMKKWDAVVFVLGLYLSGTTTISDTAPMAALYTSRSASSIATWRHGRKCCA
jgi:hypothetical protein